jgi:hypothetical protein
MLLIKEGKHHDREGSEDNIVDLEDPLLVEHLSTKSAVETEPELGHHKEHILVESIGYKIAVLPVRFTTMDK